MAGRDGRRAARWIFLSDLDKTTTRRRAVATRFGWRLIAANNRPLGRAVTLADSLDHCVFDAALVHRAAGHRELLSTITPQAEGGAWLWRVLLDDTPVAVCTHPFVRRVECARALAQFVAAAADTEPQPEFVRHYGAQALRGYEEVEAVTAERDNAIRRVTRR